MIKTALKQVQIALYQRLSQDDALSAKVNGVYDMVPSGTEYPYVTIGSPIVTPFATKTSYGESIPWVLHCYSDYNGKAETYDILNLMLQALTEAPYKIEGFSLLSVNLESNSPQVIEPAQPGMPYQGILRIRFIVNN